MAWARTVAVGGAVAGNVGGLGSDFLHECAPCPNLSSSSISLATVTPSLVMSGERTTVDDDVAAFGRGHLDGVGEGIDTFQDALRLPDRINDFCHVSNPLELCALYSFT